MAQLVGTDPGRLRLLSCGCCGTRWQFRRMGCPFCERADAHHLSAIVIERENLRIDYCQSCRAYLKTYNGEGNEALYLADWTSLHLDIIARDRGLKRLANFAVRAVTSLVLLRATAMTGTWKQMRNERALAVHTDQA